MASPPSSFSIASGSHLLSESPLLHASLSSNTGPGGADLSLSELSLNDRPRHGGRVEKPFRFSLLAPPAQYDDHSILSEFEAGGSLHSPTGDDEEQEDEGAVEQDHDTEAALARMHEEKLKNDLIVLRHLNSSFALFNEALRATQTGTEQVAAQLTQTNALLDKYVNILAKSEMVTKLILDERWEGAEADEELLEHERREIRERAKREAEERERREADEQARREAEEIVRLEQEERERLDRERKERGKPGSSSRARGSISGVSVGSGVRGVRGTRATAMAMRGGRGIPRAAPTGTTASRTRSSSAAGNIGGTRPGSSTSIRATTTRNPARRS